MAIRGGARLDTMRNDGIPPSVETADIRFRNGQIKRGIDPTKYRWRPWEWGKSDWDIIDWQKGKD